jgi:glutamyl-tRNA(Gln) amidotransferase subunit E
VSVRGGRRVEIKGVPKAGYAVKLVHNEAIRQVNLLRLRGELHARGLREPGDFRTYVQDISEILADAELVFFRKALAEGHRIFGVKVEGVSGLAAHPTQPDTTFLDELAGRVRVIACLDEPPVILCGSHLPEFPNRHRALEKLRRRLRIGPNDEFFLVFGPEQDCHTAAEEIRLRFVDAADGIPQETRQALAGGYTTFERILPGPDRMYPDTDSPPTRVTPERVQKIKAGAHEAPWDRLARYAALGIPEESGCFLIRRGGAEIVDEVARRTGVHGRVVAVEIAQHAKAMRRRGIPMDRLDAEAWTGLFDLYAGGRIPREGLPLVAARMAADGLDAVAAASAEGLEPLGREAWIGEADRVAETEAWAARVEEPGKRLSFLAGQVMARLRGRAPGRDVVHYLREKLEGLES